MFTKKDKIVAPFLFLRNTKNIYGLVLYSIQPSASWNTAPDRKYLSVFREQAGGN